MTNNCAPCFNDGVLDTTNCKCTCKKNFIGSRCQFTANPCAEDDLPECSTINCWNSTEATFFKCQKKCLCCSNKQCYNLGTLVIEAGSMPKTVNDCKCKCADVYNPATDCKTVKNCENLSEACGPLYGVEACIYPFIEAICPKMCKSC